MLVNPYSVAAVFVSVVEVALGAAATVSALAAMRRRAPSTAGASADERLHLPILVALTLAVVSAAAWPLFYLMLQSYVGRWPGVMCIQGVTRVGTGSLGAPGMLPALVVAIESLRPAAVFVAGGWIALHVANRRTRTAPFTGRVLGLLAGAGALSCAAGIAETTYVFVPKEARFLADGCCTVTPQLVSDASALRPFLAWFGEAGARMGATAVFFGAGAALLLAVAWTLRPGDVAARRTMLAIASIGGFAWLAVAAAFVTEVLSPVLLGLPLHHCAWCLLASVPDSIVGAGLVVLGVFSLGWATLTAWGAAGDEDRPGTARQVRALLRAASFGFAGALVLFTVELLIA